MLKLKEVVSEGWWDVLSKKAQAVYKKAHPGSQQAQSAKDTDGGDDNAEQLKKLDQEIQALDDAKWKAVDSGDGAAIRNWGEKLQKAKAKREKMSRTGNELNKETTMKETLRINGKQYNRITEGKINSKFIKYRIYDKIADEINKVEPDDFNLRKFNSLKRPLISFVQREVKRDKKMGTMSVLKQAWERSDFDDKVFGRSGIIDDWYKKSKRDFPKFLKRNPNLKWKNYNASSLTYGIGKSLYKIVDSLLDGINSLVPESKYTFSEFYQRFKK